jgi:hypothetical protein
MPENSYNPYRYLASTLRSQMRIEVALSESERRQTQWIVLVEFAGTQVQLVRGGVNTCIITFGKNGKRLLYYPNKALSLLDRLASQEHCRYEIRNDQKGAISRGFLLSKLKKAEPNPGDSIVGIGADCSEQVLFLAKRGVSGKYTWIREQ